MARKTKYDLDTFRKLITEGKSKPEIMAEMDIKNHPTFNNLMLKLMDSDKKYYQVKDVKRTRSVKQVIAKIGKRSTLTLSAKNLANSSFQPGDAFAVKFTKNKITLSLLEK
jgi:hypothetical protein